MSSKSIKAEVSFGVAGVARFVIDADAATEEEARRRVEGALNRDEWQVLSVAFVRALREVWPDARLTVAATLGDDTAPLVHEAGYGR